MDKVLKFVQRIIENKKGNFDIAIDCTCGRGNDTLFLVHHFKNIFAFDIQEEAIISTNELLMNWKNVRIIKDSHLNFAKYVDKMDVAMFNLGYLPKANKDTYTKKEVTIKTISLLLEKITINGIITIVCYPGFASGKEESLAIEEYLKGINQHIFEVVKYDFINQINNPPYALVIERTK